MSYYDKEKLLADLRKMDFSRSKPTAIGCVPGERDKFGNIYEDPKIVRRVVPITPIDYSNILPEMFGESWQEAEVRRIKEVIKANPDMSDSALYKLFLEARGSTYPIR